MVVVVYSQHCTHPPHPIELHGLVILRCEIENMCELNKVILLQGKKKEGKSSFQ
jgi:hypothetical protein